MPSPEERASAIANLESEDEKQARLDREKAGLGAEAPRRGRPPGSTNRPKLSDEALSLGCKQLVSLLWLLAKFPAYLCNRTLTDLSAEEKAEGTEHAKAVVQRYGFLALMLTVIGFPLWLITKVIEHAERIVEPAKPASEQPLISLVGKTPDTRQ